MDESEKYEDYVIQLGQEPNMNDLAVLDELAHFAGHAIIKSYANRLCTVGREYIPLS